MSLIKKDTIIKPPKETTYLLVKPTIGRAQQVLEYEYGEYKYGKDDRRFMTIAGQILYCLSIKELEELAETNKIIRLNVYLYHMFDEKTFSLKKLEEYQDKFNWNFSMKDLHDKNGEYPIEEMNKILKNI